MFNSAFQSEVGIVAKGAEVAEAKDSTKMTGGAQNARSSCVQQLSPMGIQNNSGPAMLKTIFAALLISASAAQPAAAATRQVGVPQLSFQIAAASAAYPIHQAEAAMIAKSANPGSTVLSVKLLPSGVYAVTLKVGGSVLQVMVDATTGAII